ncbi:MAG: rRNA maturation RNase YbeY [Clostridia bacterium]|nr:rRNA maturation RNase YbeY [Clostridia bacterium]
MTTEIIIENEQDIINFTPEHEALITKVINGALDEQSVDFDCFVSVTVVDNEAIREINNEHRNIDSATDVLSFPVLEFDENGDIIPDSGDVYEGKTILGDIVLSFQRALEQSEDFGHSFEREVGFLVCHSVLHLLGYDHEDDSERAVMREHEETILDSLGLTR